MAGFGKGEAHGVFPSWGAGSPCPAMGWGTRGGREAVPGPPAGACCKGAVSTSGKTELVWSVVSVAGGGAFARGSRAAGTARARAAPTPRRDPQTALRGERGGGREETRGV